ncbi:MAG: hypothetical protein SFW36_08810 [Leptolyngbyaceae cyanobacterium bins.59]|nr:hypothetical protein [Leptolyngbyaceae cyanobacterium bins.59]
MSYFFVSVNFLTLATQAIFGKEFTNGLPFDSAQGTNAGLVATTR